MLLTSNTIYRQTISPLNRKAIPRFLREQAEKAGFTGRRPRRTFYVYCTLWRRCWLQHDLRAYLSRRDLNRRGLRHETYRSALRALESAGLVRTSEGHHGRLMVEVLTRPPHTE